MVAFKDLFSSAVRLLKGRLTPLSGSKRRREDGDIAGEDEDQPIHQAARTAAQPSGSGQGAFKSSQAPAPESLQQAPPAPAYARVPIEHLQTYAGFDMAGRVRELAPRQAGKDDAPNGSVNPPQGALNGYNQQSQPGGQMDSANAVQASDCAQPSNAAGATSQLPAEQPTLSLGMGPAGPRQAVARPKQPHPQQPQMQPQGLAPQLAGVPPFAGPLLTPATGPSFGGTPAYSGYHMGTPRQLFNTPESTMRRFGGMRLSDVAARGTAGAEPTPAAVAQSRLGGPAAARAGNNLATSVAGAPIAGAAGRATPVMQPPPPLPPRTGYTAAAAYLGQYHHQQYPPQPQPRLPFHLSFVNNMRDLGMGPAGHVQTREELQAILRTYEASIRARVPLPTPLREDGGYVAGDDDEEGAKQTALTQQTRDVIQRLRSGLAATARKAHSDPRVAAAAVGSQAARTALEATQAAAGADALAAIGLKVATHEQMVRQLRAAVEEDTRRTLEAVKADEAARRAEMEQRQQQLRRDLAVGMQVPPPPAGAAAGAAAASTSRAGPSTVAAAAAARPASGRRPGAAAAAPPARARPPPPRRADEEDVLDLVSSDEEEDEEGVGDEGAELEGEHEDGGHAADPYGVEYGAYPGEERGGGNSGLRLASRAERCTWRRTMDPRADEGELLVQFRPNSVTEIFLPRAKLLCMEMGTWLNDEVINLYMLLLQARDTRLRRTAAAAAQAGGGGAAARRANPRCHFFNSFFYNKLFQDDGTYNYGNVRRWTSPKQLANKLQDSPNVLELDRIIMPIHKGIHWTCAEIDLRARAVRYYDSLRGEDEALGQHLLRWVSDESADKLKNRWDTSKWSVEFPKDIPQQKNGCDCGVFSIMFADRRGAGAPLDFRQADMPLLRIKVLHRIVNAHVD
ncbi:hypothetical protein PLESTB_001785400 [Pleodorina starrii]|uniref:Ubiquitin-like protease family profile domain-containing protein n=1 Tax=Pleodorina starrii TaxID=330485 RepID=A0A9W6FAF4_9CHLO|nr:hypothetical protein PLESTB_001785400 [Pleodorina starrii]GLC76539.1 hypothetical protein PLESTF_001794100 [Pleodorina starrii]